MRFVGMFFRSLSFRSFFGLVNEILVFIMIEVDKDKLEIRVL
jgi:hypothetical protein